MKNQLLSLLTFLLISITSVAQSQMVSIAGQVTDTLGQGVPNVIVTYQTSNITGAVLTNSNGNYVDTLLVQQFDSLYISIIDCDSSLVINDYVINQGTSSIVSNFNYCGAVSVPCSGTIVQNMNGLTGNFSVNTAQPSASYQWNINGTQYTGATAMHTFPGPGMYGICATYSSALCTFTICDTVVINSVPSGFGLGGQVLKSGVWAQSGLAYLYAVDTIPGGFGLVGLDTVALDSGGYYFTNLPAGIYTVQVQLDPNDADFFNFFPTYYGDVVSWTFSNSIFLSNNQWNNDINLVPVSLASPGSGNITGSVVEGPNKASGPGDPIKNIYVHLRDVNGNALEFDLTDNNGDFAFENVAFGDYQLILEIPGEAMQPHTFSLSANQASSNTVFEFDTLGVRVVLGFENELASKTSLYPNPAIDVLNIDLTGSGIENSEIRVNNIQGQTLIKENTDLNTIELNIESLKTGVYFIHISSEKGQFTKKFVVQ